MSGSLRHFRKSTRLCNCCVMLLSLLCKRVIQCCGVVVAFVCHVETVSKRVDMSFETVVQIVRDMFETD